MQDSFREYDKVVSQVIAARRKSKRTLNAVARAAGVSQASWHAVEKRTAVPSLINLRAIAMELGLRLEVLLKKRD